MVLRNVPSTATFEEQRVEINELAADVEALDAAALKAESDTLQTVTGRGSTTTNPIKIENNAATAFVVEDGSSNEKFVVDSVNGKINVGSSAGGASGIYLFHQNFTPTAITLDGATGSITAAGSATLGGLIFDTAGSHIEFTPSSWSGSAPYMEFWVGNNSGSHYAQIDGGNAGQLQIMNTGHPNGHLDLRTAKDFSVDCGGYYAILSQATGATKIWHPVSQENILNPKFETTATGAKVNGIFESSLLVNTNNTPTVGEGIEMFYDSGATGGAAGGIQAYDRDGSALTRLKIKSSEWEIDLDGSASFAGGTVSLAANLGVTIDDGTIDLYQATTNTSAKPFKLQSDVGGTKVEKASIKADGSAEFAGPQTLATPAAPATNGYTSHIDNTEASTAACYSANNHNASGINFLGVDGGNGNAITCKIMNDGTATLAGQLGVNQTSINASRQMEITQPAGFTSGLRINSAGTAGDGAYYEVFVGSANYKFGGDHSTNALLFKKDGVEYMRHTSSGGIQLDNPNGDTSLSIGDPTNSEGRLILTSKSNALEIHSRSNHPIEFLFNTTAKTKMGIDGGLSFEATGAGVVFDWQTQASGATSDKLDHYEEGTWTPVWGSTTGSITNVTYDTQSGWYTRIGRVVYVSCRLRSTATDTSGAGGGLLVSGLPFVARTPQGTGAGAAYSLIDFPAGTINITTEVRENTSQFYAGLYTLDNGNFGNIGPGSLQSSGNSEIRVSFFYMTDS